MENRYVQRAWRDLDEAEEKQRSIVIHNYKSLQKVMIELAHALRGEAMESARSESSDAPLNWTDKDWRKFWFEDRQIVHEDIATGWRKIESEETAQDHPAVLGMPRYNILDVYRTLREIANIDKQKEALADANTAHRNEMERKNSQIADLTIKLGHAEKLLAARYEDAENKNDHPAAKGETVPAPAEAKPASMVPETMFTDELSLWSKTMATDQLPDNWKTRYSKSQSSMRMIKVHQILFAMYSTGISSKNKIDWLTTLLSGTSSSNKSAYRSLQDMKEEEIVNEYTFNFKEKAFETTVTFCGLTTKGIALCEAWLLPKAKKLSTLERVINTGSDLHSPDAQLLLALSFFAETRKWTCEISPANNGTEIEMQLSQENNDTIYFIVAVPEKTPNKTIYQKITNLQSKGAKIGIVTISPERGKSLAAWCKQHNILAAYTDLYHLVNKEPGGKNIVPFTFEDYTGPLPLWVEELE
ncbi:MAG: hypothetical protein RBT34_15385 [Anaerolineaceae bacterium]|jgi:hypothetical protein|nr:hypothetical protein [Anaerolineaceae bacterium]